VVRTAPWCLLLPLMDTIKWCHLHWLQPLPGAVNLRQELVSSSLFPSMEWRFVHTGTASYSGVHHQGQPSWLRRWPSAVVAAVAGVASWEAVLTWARTQGEDDGVSGDV
jgi:hypothetical protein